MKTTDPILDERKARIEELLYIIGGLEAVILVAMEDKDWDYLKILKPQKQEYYKRLRRLSYGLPEDGKISPEQESKVSIRLDFGEHSE